MRSFLSTVFGGIVCVSFILIVIFHNKLTHYSEVSPEKTIRKEAYWEETLDFDKLQFSNETGNPSGCYLVPNYIHFIHFGGAPFKYYHLICVLAAFKNQKPDKIFFHYDNNSTFTGKYWEVLLRTPGFNQVMVLRKVKLPTEIFGQPLSEKWQKWHGSDVARIQIIMKYGGIYLDNDSYLIRSVNDYRKFEISINWDEGQFLGNQVIIAHKDARFLKRWLESYKFYDESKWYYNGGERPTVEILYKHPELIHRVKVLFGVDTGFVIKILQIHWPEWKSLYVVHIFIHHQYLLKSINEKAVYPVDFNETNIAYYPVTFREMAYDVYDIASIKWPKAKLS